MLFAFALFFLASSPSQARSECNIGHFNGEVFKLGMSTALSGPAQYIGQSMRDGMLALFERINCAGGMHGYEIDMIVRDDGYQPQSALDNMKKLVLEDEVLAVVGNVGTPRQNWPRPLRRKIKHRFMHPIPVRAYFAKRHLRVISLIFVLAISKSWKPSFNIS